MRSDTARHSKDLAGTMPGMRRLGDECMNESMEFPRVPSSDQTTQQPVIDLCDQTRWRRFVDIYDPLIYRYGRLKGLGHEDAREVVQECMALLLRRSPGLDHEREPNRFKAWLHRVAANKINDMFKRKRPALGGQSDFGQALGRERSLDELWEEQWQRKHLRSCLKDLLAQVAETTRQAFQLHVVSGWPVEEVAETLNISVDQVYAARSRITQRLRQMAREILGDEVGSGDGLDPKARRAERGR